MIDLSNQCNNQVPRSLRNISFYYQNVRGLRTKTSNVFVNSKALDSDIFVLTETWLHEGINSLEIFDQSYSIYRKDRYQNPISTNTYNGAGFVPMGGGVLIAIKNSFNAIEISLGQFSKLEMVVIETKLTNKSLFVVCCYIPPNSVTDIYLDFCLAVDYISSLMKSSDEILICGDFNLPNICWSAHDEECFLIPNNLVTQSEYTLVDGCNANGLQQICHKKNYKGKQLDLVFTSDWDNFTFNENSMALVNIDNYHPPISFSYYYDNDNAVDSPQIISYKYNFLKTDFIGLNNYLLAVDFSTLFNNVNMDEAVANFYDVLLHGFSMYVPSVRDRGYSSSPPWFNTDLRKLKNKKNKAWRKYLKHKNEESYIDFSNKFSAFKSLLDINYKTYIEDVACRLKSNPKTFWKFVNSKRKSDQYPNFMSFDGLASNDPEIIAKSFKSFFSASYSSSTFDVDITNFSHLNNLTEIPLSPIEFSETNVKKYLDALNDDAFSGPDNVPEIILKKCAASLSSPLSTLFNKSLSLGIFPDLWKKSFIRPVHKKDSKNDISNYRPIAKLSSIPKLFELIIYDSIYNHCSNLLVSNQHGFMKKKSTVTNLVETSSDFFGTMEAGFQTDVVYTDLSKAFDILPHSIILFKLKALGFPTFLIKWVNSYLTNRNYSVIFRNAISEPFYANSGVPQGSHLGPLLFIISINDVTSVIKNSKVGIYADDMKIYRRITSLSDAALLQADLNSFLNWCKINNLKLNIEKCAVLSFTRRSMPIDVNYTFHDKIIKRVTEFKDLGVLFDNKLSFKQHYNMIINKGNSMLGFIKRWSKEFNDPHILKSLFISLVRPNFEYASPAWSPYYKVHIDRIESIQKKFLRCALSNLPWSNPIILPPYKDRLILLDLKSLESRRVAADILFITQINNGQIISASIKDKIISQINTRSRFRSEDIFRLAYHRTNYGKFEPINRMFIAVNKSKEFIDFSLSKEQLKRLLYQKLT